MGKLLRKKRSKESYFKYIMSVSHLWLGLFSSILVFSTCLSGSLYAFKNQIENLDNYSKVYLSEEAKRRVSIDQLIKQFEAEYSPVTSVFIPEDNKSIRIDSRDRGAGISTYYHPTTGAFLGLKNSGSESFFNFVLDWHRNLLLGETGKTINGIAILIFLYMLVSGFVLWLPKKLKQLKNGLLVKWKARFYRLNYDLHKVLGFYSLLLLLFISITGLYVSFHWIKNTIIVSLGGNSIVISEENTALNLQLSSEFNALLNAVKKENPSTKNSPLSIDQLIAKTNQELPYSGDLIIGIPQDDIKIVSVVKYDSPYNFNIPNQLEYNVSGKLIKQELFIDLELHEQFKKIAKPLHTGEIMGLGSIILYFLVSLMGCSLPITGFIIWWRKG